MGWAARQCSPFPLFCHATRTIPGALKRFIPATRIGSSAMCRSGSLAAVRVPKGLRQRIFALAFRQVPFEPGAALGANPFLTLLLCIGQGFLRSLAVVVLAGLAGSGRLGAKVTRGLTPMGTGLGLLSAGSGSLSPFPLTGFPARRLIGRC